MFYFNNYKYEPKTTQCRSAIFVLVRLRCYSMFFVSADLIYNFKQRHKIKQVKLPAAAEHTWQQLISSVWMKPDGSETRRSDSDFFGIVQSNVCVFHMRKNITLYVITSNELTKVFFEIFKLRTILLPKLRNKMRS